MATPIANIQPQFDTFAGWLSKTNQLINDMSTVVVTVDTTTNGALTSGNAYVNGIFTANTFAVLTSIRGGNGSTPATLTVSSNTALGGYSLLFGNSTAQTSVNSIAISIGNTTVNTTVNATSLFTGNSSVYTTVNATSFSGIANSTLNIGGANATSNVSISNNYLISPAFKSYSEYESNVTVSSTSTTLDLSTSNFFNLALQSNTTFTFSNAPSGRAFTFNIVTTQDSTGGRLITFPTGSKYDGGVIPPQTTNANAVDVWTVATYNGGTTWLVSLSMKNAS